MGTVPSEVKSRENSESSNIQTKQEKSSTEDENSDNDSAAEENNTIIEEQYIDCVLDHPNCVSTIFCPQCNKIVCIDCHFFFYLNKKGHRSTLKEIEKELNETYPKDQDPHKSGFYPYTEVMQRMQGRPIIQPVPIYMVSKDDTLLKILRVTLQDSQGEFVLKQIIPLKYAQGTTMSQEYLDEYKMMDHIKDICIRSYNLGIIGGVTEMLMENWGLPCNQCNMLQFTEKEFLQVLRECSLALCKMHREGIFHGDIKMENLILNPKAFIPKFIDFGTSSLFPEGTATQIIFEQKEGNLVTSPITYFKGLTYHMSPPEVLQYTNYEDIKYSLSQIDVFSLGMTFFGIIARENFNQAALQKLRAKKENGQLFQAEIERILKESLENVPWESSFKIKIIEIIKSSLQHNLELRPNSEQLFGLFQYFHILTVEEYNSLLSNINSNNKLKELVMSNRFNEEYNKEVEIKGYLRIIEEYNSKLPEIFGDGYKRTEEYMQICYRYGCTHLDDSNPKLSEKWLLEGLALAQNIFTPLHPFIQIYYEKLCNLHAYLKEDEEAEMYINRCIGNSKQIHGDKPHPDIIIQNYLLGMLYLDKGDIEKAEETQNKTLCQIFEVFGDKPNDHDIDTYAELGAIYKDKEEFVQAEKMYLTALDQLDELYAKNSSTRKINILHDLGSLYSSQFEENKAEEILNKALNYAFAMGGHSGQLKVVQSYLNLGSLYHDQEDYERAEVMYTKALQQGKTVHKHGIHSDLAKCYTNLAFLYADLGQYDRAIDYQGDTVKIILEIYKNDLCSENVKETYETLLRLIKRREEYLINTGIKLFNTLKISISEVGYLNSQNQKEELINHLSLLSICFVVIYLLFRCR